MRADKQITNTRERLPYEIIWRMERVVNGRAVRWCVSYSPQMTEDCKGGRMIVAYRLRKARAQLRAEVDKLKS